MYGIKAFGIIWDVIRRGYKDMWYKEELICLLEERFGHLGMSDLPNGTRLIGKIPNAPGNWFLASLYAGLNLKQIEKMEEIINTSLPTPLKEFYGQFNGLRLFGLFFIDGLRFMMGGPEMPPGTPNYQPISLEQTQRQLFLYMEDPPVGAVFFGGYLGQEYRLYITPASNSVFLCSFTDPTPIYEWKSIGAMVLDMAEKHSDLYNEEGLPKNEETFWRSLY